MINLHNVYCNINGLILFYMYMYNVCVHVYVFDNHTIHIHCVTCIRCNYFILYMYIVYTCTVYPQIKARASISYN